jgi:tetratricopeptide (TPR) repeat protein
VVRAAAVIGHEAPVWLLESVIGRALEPGVLRQLARSDFLLAQPGGVLRFTHGLTRDVIYSMVAAEDRRALHGAIAAEDRRALHGAIASRIAERHGPEGERECCELLAAHFAGATVWDAAARFAEMSGKKAEIASVLDRARFHYGAALKHMAELEDSPARYQRWMKICRRYAFACVYDAAKDQLPTFELAVARARARGDRLQTCEANFWLGYVLHALGLSGRAIARLEEAACEARALGQEELCLQIAASLGQAYSSASRHDRSSDLPGQTIEVKRRYRKPGKPAVSLAYSLACMASIYGDQGRFRDAYALTDEALDGIAGTGHEVESSVLLWKSGVLLWQGRWEEAREAAAQARRVGERVKSLFPHGRGAAHEAYAGWRLGPQDDLVERLRSATGWLESGRKQLFISLSYRWLAEVMAARGAWDEMRGHAARALTCGRRSDLLGGAMAMRALARAAAEGRMAHGPGPYLARAMRNAPHEVAETRLLEARLLCGAAGRGHGERLLDLAEAAFEEMEMPAKVAETRQARAVIAA